LAAAGFSIKISRMFRHARILGAAVFLAATLLSAAVLYTSSASSPNRALYFWRTEWASSAELQSAMKDAGINRLYMRFFDVEWDNNEKTAHPIAPLRFSSPAPNGVEVVPVIYLVNAVFLKMSYEDVPKLADNVLIKVRAMADFEKIPFKELQLDCDWTDDSRRNYFRFVEILHNTMKSEGRSLSATLRLHQVKYASRSGIPSIDHGMLMFYNFSQIQGDEPGHSIFSEQDAARYTSYIARYPLKLDVVLPMFSWSVHARDGEVLGLLEGIGSAEAGGFEGFREQSANRYAATRSFFFRGRYFMEGDSLLVEETTPRITRQAAALARRGAGWSRHYDTVALFDIDQDRLKDYSSKEIRGILNEF
jgi:hypothetical protein